MNGSRRWHLALFLVLLARVCRATESDIEEVQDGNLPRVASCEEGIGVLNPGNQTVQGSRCYKRRIVLVDGTERVGRTSRWQLPKYHRVKDSGYFFHSLRIHVRIAHKGWTSSKVRFCIHRNESAPFGHCPGRWKLPKKEIWGAEVSPFFGGFLEIDWIPPDQPQDLYISIIQDVDRHRIAWFIIGLILMPLSGVLSQIVLLYYGVGMSVGIVLIVAFVLFQIMKLLPLTRGSSVKVVFAGALMGLGTIMVSYLNGLATEAAEQLGLGDYYINPMVYLAILGVCLVGAASGFWFVRKLVLTPSGDLDPSTIVFVRWTLRVAAGALLIGSSADPIFGTAALLLGIAVTVVTGNLGSLFTFLASHKKRFWRGSKGRDSDSNDVGEEVIPGTPERDTTRARVSPTHVPGISLHAQAGPSGAYEPRLDSNLVLRQPFVSAYYRNQNQRGALSPEAYAAVTQECTRAAMADLVNSPAFGTWAMRNLNRIQIIPEASREQRESSEIAATANMEEGPYKED